MQQRSGATQKARVAVRLSQEDHGRVEEAVGTRGYANPVRSSGPRSGTN